MASKFGKPQGAPKGIKSQGLQPVKAKVPGKSVQNGSKSQQIGGGKKVLPQIKRMTDRFDDMIAGCLDALPPKPPSKVRIFLSSTFSDMRAERNALAKESYPAIKEYCNNTLDLDFQVVDLRWGINSYSSNEHSAGKICLAEIENCQKVSLGPNFVTMLSHRYGHQHIPVEIDEEEFNILMAEVTELGMKQEKKITKWYMKDENNVPPIYVLLPTTSTKAQSDWNKDMSSLQAILRQGVDNAHKKGLVSDVTRHKYYKSVTEEEIEKGILEAESAGTHTTCFIRKLTDLTQDKLTEQNATRYINTIDKDGKVCLDQDIKDFISDIQDVKIPSKLSSKKLHTYQVPWKDGGISPADHDCHKLYIDKFCKDFTFEIIKMIEEAKHLRDNQIPVSEYYTDFDELLHHMHFCNTKCENFKGQDDILSSIHHYLTNMKNRKPLVIHADSGVGKTSLMAMVMKLLPRWFGLKCMRLIRFLGTSPESTDIFDVLFSVMGQLADHHNMILEPVGYRNTKSIIKYLPRFLRNVSRSTKEHIFILLDSIDQLSETDGAYKMHWLPVELPPNVHLILSMLPVTHSCLENTQAVLKQDDNCFLELQILPVKTSTEIIKAYLAKHNRAYHDIEKLLKVIAEEPTPLFLKLFLDQVLSLRSFNTIDITPTSANKAIELLFSDIEKRCGSVTHSVILYLTYGLNGLTEVELEDVLSMDNEALDSVYIHHDPPVSGVIRIPSVVLTRILYLLQEYLIERRSQGKKTLYWYHRQFIEQSKTQAKNAGSEISVNKKLADLYLAKKPVKQTIKLKHRKKTLENLDRLVTLQPLTCRNKRKLQALPYHLTKCKDIKGLKKHCLLNLAFMMTKLKAFSMRVLLQDYPVDQSQDEEITLLVSCLRDMKETVTSSGLPLELIARLPGNTGINMPLVTLLLENCRHELKTNQTSVLLPLYPCLGGSSLQQVYVPGVRTVTSCTGTMMLVECCDLDLPEAPPTWKLIDCVCAKVRTVPGQFTMPPVLTDNGDSFLTFRLDMEKSVVIINIFSSETLKVTASYEILLNTKQLAVSCARGDLKNVTFAQEGLSVTSYNLGTKKSNLEKSSDKMNAATEFCHFTLDVPRSDKMIIKAVYRFALIGSKKTQFVSLVDGEGDGESYVVVTSVLGQEPKQLPVCSLPGNLLLDHVHLVEGPNQQLLVSSYRPQDTLYTVKRIAVDSGEILEEHQFSDVVDISGVPPAVTLGMSMAVPTCTDGKQMLTVFGAHTTALPIVEDVTPTCTYVADKGNQIWGDTAGRIHIQEISSTVYKPYTLMAGTPLKSLYFSSDMSVLTVLGQNGELSCWRWNDIFARSRYLDKTEAGKVKLTFESMMVQPTRVPVQHPSEEDDSRKEVTDGEATTDDDTLTVDQSIEASKEHLEKHGQALSIMISRDETQIWTLDKDCKIRIWDLPSCTLNKVLATVKDGIVGQVGELAGSIHTSEPGFCLAYFPKLKELALSNALSCDCFQHFTSIAAYCLDVDDTRVTEGRLYMLVSTKHNKYNLDIRTYPFDESDQTISIKDTVIGGSICMKLSANRQHVVLAVESTIAELDIIVKAVKKNNMHHHDGSTKFYAVDIEKGSGALVVCYRQLTKIPCLANSWDVFSDNLVVFGLNRTTIMWDIVSGSCDQRMIKGTKTAMVYRPEWIEDDRSYMKICDGKTVCMERAHGGDVLAVGSEDGYVLAYAIPRGHSVLQNVGKKPNHKNTVEHITVSRDGKWIASYCSGQILKIWNVSNKMQESASIGLSLVITGFKFSDKSTYLTVYGQKENGQRKVFVFKLLILSKI